MHTTRLFKLVGVLGVLVLAACSGSASESDSGSGSGSEPGESGEFTALQEATVTLFPGHCAGVIVEDGRHALTAAHCIDGTAGQRIPVVLRDGTTLGGMVVIVDALKDVAVIRFDEAAPVRALPVAAVMPEPGAGLLFAGRNDRPNEPQQVELRRLGRCPSLPGVPLALFTSLRGEKGDSGAPVVDHEFRVVGLVHGGAACSIATPTAAFAPVLDTLVAEAARPPGEQGIGGSGTGGR